MATTYIHPLKSARASMIYTELGNGEKKKMHEAEGTTRAAFEVGDMPRDDMAVYAEEVHKKHPLSCYEAFEVRVSFSPDELKAGDADDEQMAGEHSYKLCKKLYPNSMCYVTVHNDGKGGCVHAHCLVVNHDEVTGKTLRDNRRHFEVKDASDELAAEEGLSVIGVPKFERDRLKDGTTWDERRKECTSFEQRLGDKVQRARDSSDTLDEFKQHLHWAGVELMEQKRMGKGGIEHEAWCYKMEDIDSPKRRKRRRKAKLLADDLTKDSIESYYAQKQVQNPVEASQPTVASIYQENVSEDATESIKGYVEDEAAYPLLDDYKIDEDDVKCFADCLESQYRKDAIRNGRILRNDATYAQINRAQQAPAETTAKLQADVDEARAQFKADKANLDELKTCKTPNLHGIMRLFDICRKKAKTPFERMIDEMFSEMMKNLLKVFAAEQRRRQIEEAERKLYKSRRKMWDDEKRLKAAQRIVKKEKARSVRKTRSLMQDIEEAEKRGGEDFEFGQ